MTLTDCISCEPSAGFPRLLREAGGRLCFTGETRQTGKGLMVASQLPSGAIATPSTWSVVAWVESGVRIVQGEGNLLQLRTSSATAAPRPDGQRRSHAAGTPVGTAGGMARILPARARSSQARSQLNQGSPVSPLNRVREGVSSSVNSGVCADRCRRVHS